MKPPQEKGEPAKISPKKKFEILLTLFGSDNAREHFISLCREYDTERSNDVAVAGMGDAENYRHGRKAVPYSPPKRAHLHNRIMEIIGKLATQSKKLTPHQEKVLTDLGSRENVAQAIHAYVLNRENEDDGYDEEEEIRKGQKQSEVAYYHSLGRDH